jgi:hypothetical protein
MSDKTPTIYADSPSPVLVQLHSKQMDLESGWLGKLFGSSKIAPSNIAGLTLLLLVLPGVALLFFSGSSMTAADYWKFITPIVTLILGYLFGKNV